MVVLGGGVLFLMSEYPGSVADENPSVSLISTTYDPARQGGMGERKCVVCAPDAFSSPVSTLDKLGQPLAKTQAASSPVPLGLAVLELTR